jgi:hypothetical protein
MKTDRLKLFSLGSFFLMSLPLIDAEAYVPNGGFCSPYDYRASFYPERQRSPDYPLPQPRVSYPFQWQGVTPTRFLEELPPLWRERFRPYSSAGDRYGRRYVQPVDYREPAPRIRYSFPAQPHQAYGWRRSRPAVADRYQGYTGHIYPPYWNASRQAAPPAWMAHEYANYRFRPMRRQSGPQPVRNWGMVAPRSTGYSPQFAVPQQVQMPTFRPSPDYYQAAQVPDYSRFNQTRIQHGWQRPGREWAGAGPAASGRYIYGYSAPARYVFRPMTQPVAPQNRASGYQQNYSAGAYSRSNPVASALQDRRSAAYNPAVQPAHNWRFVPRNENRPAIQRGYRFRPVGMTRQVPVAVSGWRGDFRNRNEENYRHAQPQELSPSRDEWPMLSSLPDWPSR